MLGQFGDLVAALSYSSKDLILWERLLCLPPQHLNNALCRWHTNPHTQEVTLLPRTYENSVVKMQLSEQVRAPWQLMVQSLKTCRLLDRCSDVVLLREQSCKPHLELDRVTVSPSITAHIICKAHKMWQTTNNLWRLALGVASHWSFYPHLPVAANCCVPAWDPEGKFSSHDDSWTVSISRHIFPTSRAGEAQLCWETSPWHLHLQYSTQLRSVISC